VEGKERLHLNPSDYQDVLAKIEELHQRGDTLRDVTSVGLGRDPIALREISEAVGINVIAGSGYYISASHSDSLSKQTIDEISLEIVHDISKGIGDTGIRSGIIGEIGTSLPIHPAEERVLRASARAHLETGCPISVHVFSLPVSKDAVFQILKTFEDEGVGLDRVAMCHMDHGGKINLEFHRDVIKKGAYVEYDGFGREEYLTRYAHAFPRDIDRVEAIAKLAMAGHLSKVLVSQDICLRTSLKQYGGYGYDHLLKRVVPMMKKAGLNDADIETLLISNPSTFLSF
jgi:phosphotriesterase-related protein